MESKKKKLLKFLVVISTVFMLVISMCITSFASSSILIPSKGDGTWAINSYFAPDTLSIRQTLPEYPNGSEIIEEGYLDYTFGKIQTAVISNDEYQRLINGENISWSVFESAQVRNYAEDTYPDFTAEYVDMGYWNRINRYGDFITYYSTLNKSSYNQYYVTNPTFSLTWESIVMGENIADTRPVNYIQLQANGNTGYVTKITSNVSTFNNVTGEMSVVSTSYTNVAYTDSYNRLNINLYDLFTEIGKNVEHNGYYQLSNIIVTITPTVENVELDEFRIRTTAYETDYPNIEDVWNTQNEAYNWTNFTDWIQTAVTGFLSFEVMPNISLMGIMTVFVGFAVFVWFMKMFAGG